MPRTADGRGIGDLPTRLHRWNDDEWIEDGERGGDEFARDLPHERSAAREVRDTFGQGDTVHVARARLEAQCDVVRVAFGREVHLADHGFECGAECAAFGREFLLIHGPRVRDVRPTLRVEEPIDAC